MNRICQEQGISLSRKSRFFEAQSSKIAENSPKLKAQSVVLKKFEKKWVEKLPNTSSKSPNSSKSVDLAEKYANNLTFEAKDF